MIPPLMPKAAITPTEMVACRAASGANSHSAPRIAATARQIKMGVKIVIGFSFSSFTVWRKKL